MNKRLITLLLLWGCGGVWMADASLAESRKLELVVKVQPGPNQSSEELVMLNRLRLERELNEQAGKFLSEIPELRQVFKAQEFVPLAIALFNSQILELAQSSELKAELIFDTTLIPNDPEQYKQKTIYVLESIAQHQLSKSQLEADLNVYLQALAQAGNSEQARLLRETQGQKLKNRYQGDRAFIEATSLLGLQRWQDSLKKLDESLRLDPEFVGAYFLRAVAYVQNKQYDKALGDLNQAQKLAPQNEAIYFFRGLTYLVQGALLHQALGDFNKTIELRPDHAQAFYLRGVTYHRLDQCDAAKQDFIKACSLGDQKACSLDCQSKHHKEIF